MNRLLLLVIAILLIVLLKYVIFRNNFTKCDSSGIEYRVNSNQSLENRKYSSGILNISREISLIIKEESDNELFNERINGVRFEELYTDDYDIMGVSVNKGEIIKLRIYEKDGTKMICKEIYDTLIHELAHLLCMDYGHGEEFRRNHSLLKNKYKELILKMCN